ncbi:MAG: OsmC family protein [Polyangiaceae bacterium]
MKFDHPAHGFECHTTWTGASAGPTVNYRSYSRDLLVEIPGKPAIKASSAAAFLGDGALHNPEDMLMAALSTCHCLSYLALAARAGIAVIAYEDAATGTMEWEGGTYHFSRAVLHPKVTVQKGADLAKARALHEEAHKACFIARSVNFPVDHEAAILEAP